VPEGDTIHKLAARLAPALVDRTVTRIEVTRARTAPKAGTAVTAVEAVGKHLLIRFADGHVLRTHLGMTGRWDLYQPGQRWRRPRHLARAVIEVDGEPGAVAVCFSAPTVELARARRDAPPAALAGVAHLGPDLCRPDTDLDEVVARMGSVPAPGTAIADVLLDQRVAAGVGNVFKSEVLWACRIHPLTPVDALDEEIRTAIVATAADLLRRNLGPGPRTTLTNRSPGSAGRLAVYGRTRRSCPRCGTPIQWARTGPVARGTYWCPRCQPG
jgi:endonuclease-8